MFFSLICGLIYWNSCTENKETILWKISKGIGEDLFQMEKSIRVQDSSEGFPASPTFGIYFPIRDLVQVIK